MKVLSLFDGISCGMVSLERAGIPVERYVAYEIDKYAIQVSKKNYPEIEHHGDVFEGDFTKYKGFDLLIGGSPCTYWSVARKGRETTPDGIGGKLFMEYVRALKESECRYFLYENNYSIHKDIKAFISEQLGVQPIMINSALVSGQQRKRCYWTNIPNVIQPEDKGILLKDVLENAYSETVKELSEGEMNYLCRAKMNQRFINSSDRDKSHCVVVNYCKGVPYNVVTQKVSEPIGCAVRGRYIESGSRSKKCDGGTFQAVEVRKDGKSNAVTTVNKDCMVTEPIKVGTLPRKDGIVTNSKQYRIYSVKGKSVTICGQGGGLGAKTGLYKIGLPDGDYIIRKLTPVETERLQTLPDNYTEGISDTQRYKCIGNGWTVDVIAHILKGLKGEIVKPDGSYRPFPQEKRNCKTCANLMETGKYKSGKEYIRCRVESENRYPYSEDGIICARYEEAEE